MKEVDGNMLKMKCVGRVAVLLALSDVGARTAEAIDRSVMSD